MKRIIPVILGLAITVAAADVILELTVPDAYVPRAIDAFNGLQGKKITISYSMNDSSAYTRFTFPTKDPNETTKDFAERGVRRTIKALIEAYEYELEVERYNSDIQNIDPIDVNVPDEIIQ